MPDPLAPGFVGMRIRREHAAGNIFGQRPLLRRRACAGETEFHFGKVARLIPFTRSDQHRDEIARLHAHVFERPERHQFPVAGFAFRQPLPGSSAPQFEGPCHAGAALGIDASQCSLYLQGRGDRTAPAGRGDQSWRRMQGHAARLHVSRHAHRLAGGIGNQHRRFRRAPSLHEIEGRGLLNLLGQQIELEIGGRVDAEEIEPRAERCGIDAEPAGERAAICVGFGSRHQRFRGCPQNLRAPRAQLVDKRAQVAKQHWRAAGDGDLRFAPLDEVSGLAVAGIVSGEVDRDIVTARRSRQFDAELLLDRPPDRRAPSTP